LLALKVGTKSAAERPGTETEPGEALMTDPIEGIAGTLGRPGASTDGTPGAPGKPGTSTEGTPGAPGRPGVLTEDKPVVESMEGPLGTSIPAKSTLLGLVNEGVELHADRDTTAKLRRSAFENVMRFLE